MFLDYFSDNKSFTLVELLVVIGILAVLTAAVVVIINPAEYLRQTRDVQRMNDLASVNQALSVLESQGITSFGTSSVVYVSIPDTSTTCVNLGLPTLPGGYSYNCVSSSTLQKVDGTGWIPVAFNQSTALSLPSLPIDPTNTTSSGNYYTYTPGGSWELDSIFESYKYRNNTQITKTNLPGVYAIGSNKTLSPLFNTSGLVGYWPFDEGSGTTAYDKSGNGNTATWVVGSPAWVIGSECKDNNCARFNDYSYVSASSNLLGMGTNLSLTFWIKGRGLSPSGDSVHMVQKWNNTSDANYVLYWCGNSCGTDGTFKFYGNTGTWDQIGPSVTYNYGSGEWIHLALVFDSSYNANVFANGSYVGTWPHSGPLVTSDSALRIGNDIGAGYSIYFDDLRIYNRALSASEISAIYNATK